MKNLKNFDEKVDVEKLIQGRNRFERVENYRNQIDDYLKQNGKPMPTKLEKLLIERNLSQGDLMRLIQWKSGFKIGRDRISKICTGRMKNYTIETAVMIAEALDVPVDEIIELKDIKKENKF